MSGLQALLDGLAQLDAGHDLIGMRALRERIVSEFPDSDAAAEACYKIGLDMLFRERQLEAAVGSFEAAARRNQPYWSAAARTSLGLCYHHQQRTQKALFELRKVGYAKQPNVHSVTALAFIENIFAAENNPDEVLRVRRDRVHQLEHLVQASREPAGEVGERGYYLLQLGVALRDSGNSERATAVLEEARSLGQEALGAELYRLVIDALSQ